MRLLTGLLSVSLLFVACSSGGPDQNHSPESNGDIPEHLQDVENLTVLPENPEPQYKIELVEEHSFGDKYDEVVHLGYINDFAVDDRGRVYLADMSNDRIHVYNPDGSFLQSIGRAGRGPGEFLTTRGGLNIGVNEEYLFVYDDTNFRVSRFYLDTYELADVANLEMRNWDHIDTISGRRPFDFYYRKDGTYLVQFRIGGISLSADEAPSITNLRSYFVHFDQNIEPVSDVIMEYEHPEIIRTGSGSRVNKRSFPLANRHLMVISGSGHIYRAYTDEFLIRTYRSDGTYARAVYAPWEATSFTRAHRDTLLDTWSAISRTFNVLEVPDRWPLLDQIVVDDQNRLWVSIYTDSMDSTEWRVLDEEGNLLGSFDWPRKLLNAFPGHDSDNYIIKNGALYYLDTNPLNLSTQMVRKFRIEMTPVRERG
ncbi:MAG: 6-bladed beta-propeller [Balneolaceae bacterium]|nr:6-bladed beta-propeller [Balneolaceae bacterium]